MDNEKLATELLHELKASAQRWFIAFIIMVVVEVLTIAGFLWYISLPVEEYDRTVLQQAEDTQDTQMIGGDYNGESQTND